MTNLTHHKNKIVGIQTASTVRRTGSIMLCVCAISGITALFAQTVGRWNNAASLTGSWSGTRTERNPVTGRPYTINFEFQFRADGSYFERAGFGRATILEAEGVYAIHPGSKPGNPRVSHILSLSPLRVDRAPSPDELNALQVADLPNTERTEQWVFFYDLDSGSALTLQDVRAGAETWGLQRSR